MTDSVWFLPNNLLSETSIGTVNKYKFNETADDTRSIAIAE